MDWLPVAVRENPGQTILVLWGLIILAGVFLALGKRATIYRSVGDAAFTFLVLVLLLVGLLYVKTEILGPAALVVSAIGVVIIIISTFIDNKNPLYGIIAIVTKITLSFLFVVLMIGALFPGGNTLAEQRADRTQSLGLLSILTPLIYLLIRDRKPNEKLPSVPKHFGHS
jgi:hypothetical protein